MTGYKDVYLVRTDANGDTLWTRQIGDEGNYDTKYAEQTLDGGFVVTGSAYNFSNNSFDVFLIKTDSAGNLLWSKMYGGSADDYGYSLQETSDSDLVICGHTFSFGSGLSDIYLIKTSSDGSLKWSRTYGSASIDASLRIQNAHDGGFIVFGTSNGNFLMRTNTDGDTTWTHRFFASVTISARCVSETADSGFIVCGYYGTNPHAFFAARLDAQGHALWANGYDRLQDDYGTWCQQSSDGGFIIAGYSVYQEPEFLKLDGSGNLMWSKRYIPPLGGFVTYVLQSTDGSYVSTGYKNGVSGNTDFYLIKTDSAGNTGCNQGSSFFFSGVIPFQDSAAVISVSSAATVASNVSVVVISGGTVNTLCTTVGLNADLPTEKNALNIYPNPARSSFTIQWNEELKLQNADLIISDLTGREVYYQKIHSQQSTVYCQLNAGVYFVKVTEGEKQYVQKLIVE